MAKLTPGQRYWMTGLRDVEDFDRDFSPSPNTVLSCVRRGWTAYGLAADGTGKWGLTDEGRAMLDALQHPGRRGRRRIKVPLAVGD